MKPRCIVFTFLLLSLAAAGCRLRGTQMEANPLLKFLERKRGLISFVGPDKNIYTMDQAGGRKSALTTDAGGPEEKRIAYDAPTWSHEGRYVAFGKYSSGGEDDFQDVGLLVAEWDGKNRRTLLADGIHIPFYIYFSPDSQYVSVLSQIRGQSYLELGIAPVQVGGQYRVLDSGAPFFWTWWKDRKSILVHANASASPSEDSRVSIIDVKDSFSIEHLPVYPAAFQTPDISPDGKKILYATSEAGTRKLLYRDLQSGQETALLSSPGMFYFGFSPDGRRVAYLESQSATPLPMGKVGVITLGSKKPPVTLKEQKVIAFFWSPDSKKLACVTPISSEKEAVIEPMFALDENLIYLQLKVADAKNGSSWLAARFPVTEAFLNTLPFFDQFLRSDTFWSPDSRYLVFTAYTQQGDTGVFLASADGNIKPRFLEFGDNASWSRK